MWSKSVKPRSAESELAEPAINTQRSRATHMGIHFVIIFFIFIILLIFSHRSANAGSNLAAFKAGNNPPSSAVATEATTEIMATRIG